MALSANVLLNSINLLSRIIHMYIIIFNLLHIEQSETEVLFVL